jgi:soluble lytic murein transglycosylase-like protein
MKYLLALLLWLVPAMAYASNAELRKLFSVIAAEEDVQAPLLRAVCWVESRHRNVSRIVDGKSPSYGICQIKLATARMLGFTGQVRELKVLEVNIRYAAKYLRYQLNRYKQDWRKAVTAYNRGTFRGRLINRYVILVTVAMLEGR